MSFMFAEMPFDTSVYYNAVYKTVTVVMKGQLRVLGPFSEETEGLFAAREFVFKRAAYCYQHPEKPSQSGEQTRIENGSDITANAEVNKLR